MSDDPLKELRDLRHRIEDECIQRGLTYAEYLSELQGQYMDRLVRREPKPRLEQQRNKVA